MTGTHVGRYGIVAGVALAVLSLATVPVRGATGDTLRPAACAPPAPGRATCAALARPDAAAALTPAAAPSGYGPQDLRDAYGLPYSALRGGAGAVAAVVSAYDDPDAASDLAAYRAQYDLPACTATDGCFSKVNQTGGTSYPVQAAGWSAVDAESLDMISAVCPNCHLILVEANSSAVTDLGTAENEAVTLGAEFIDNDWLTPESAQDPGYDSAYFDHPGVAITAPSGNSGYGTVNYPAASQYVTAVGGTVLTQETSSLRGWSESASSTTGSGCSEYDPKPSWQTDTGCAGRTLNDVAAVADDSTPVAIYDTPTLGGWGTGSGTAVASAIVAGAYALAGTPAAGTYPASYPYAHASLLNDITTGSNGTCSPAYLCTAGPGYDGPTGLGTPASAAAFSANPANSFQAVCDLDGPCLNATSSAAGHSVTMATFSSGDASEGLALFGYGGDYGCIEVTATCPFSNTALDAAHLGQPLINLRFTGLSGQPAAATYPSNDVNTEALSTAPDRDIYVLDPSCGSDCVYLYSPYWTNHDGALEALYGPPLGTQASANTFTGSTRQSWVFRS